MPVRAIPRGVNLGGTALINGQMSMNGLALQISSNARLLSLNQVELDKHLDQISTALNAQEQAIARTEQALKRIEALVTPPRPRPKDKARTVALG